MAVDGDLQNILDMIKEADRPPYRDVPVAEARQGYQAMVQLLDPEEEAIHRTEDRTIPGPAGEIPLRLYWPRELVKGESLGVLIFLHGGGFVIGDLDTHDPLCRRLCNRGDCIVVSVEYRLAPEHPFPASGEDCIAAMQWCAQNAAELGGDSGRLAVGGDSAGGNLSAVCALHARDNGGPDLRLQLLIYPAVAPRMDSASHAAFGEGHLLTSENMQWFMEQYYGVRDLTENPAFAPRSQPITAVWRRRRSSWQAMTRCGTRAWPMRKPCRPPACRQIWSTMKAPCTPSCNSTAPRLPAGMRWIIAAPC